MEGFSDDDELLDQSEYDLVFRTIVAAGKEPCDAATVREYIEGYLDLRRRLRLNLLEPVTRRVQ